MGRKKNIEKLKEFKEELGKHIKLDKMILFGSRVKDKATRYSDFDLIVVSPSFRGKRDLQRGFIIELGQNEELLDPQGIVVGLRNGEKRYVAWAARTRVIDRESEIQLLALDELRPNSFDVINSLQFTRKGIIETQGETDELFGSFTDLSFDPLLTAQIYEYAIQEGDTVRWAYETDAPLLH